MPLDNRIESTFQGRKFLVNGRPFFMRGGDIHYFRLPVEVWEIHLQQAKSFGINTITACIPWHFHEPAEAEFDFTGQTKPERNLIRFIELVAQNGLKLVAHPGPFINCEFRTGGIPEWLYRNYPETMSRRADGHIATGSPVPAEGEPLYREYVKRWYEAIVPLLAQYQADRSGPIILFQPDNELSAAWSYGLLNSLYDPYTINQRWPKWLSKKYESVELFNQITGGKFSEFFEIKPPKSFPRSTESLVISYEWMEFKRHFFGEWGACLATWAQELGINTPFIFNQPIAGFYGHGDHAGFGNALKNYGLKGATVIHSYADRIFDLDGLVQSLLGVELMKSSPWGGPLFSIEVNCNWYMARCSRSAINWSPLLRTSLAHGLNGFSVFPYSEATSDGQDSIIGPDYFTGTCLDLSGHPTTASTPVEHFNRLLGTWEDSLVMMEAPQDLLLAYSPAMRLLDFLGAPSCLEGKYGVTMASEGGAFSTEPNRGGLSVGHGWLDGYENVSKQTVSPETGLWNKVREAFALLCRLNFQFGMLDLTNPIKPPGSECLIVPCTGAMETEAIDYLLRHLESGGQCLFFPTIPLFSTSGKKDLRIAQKLGVSLSEQIRPAGGEILRYGAQIVETKEGKNFTESGWIYVHNFPEGSEVLASISNKPIVAKVGPALISGMDARFITGSTLKFWKSVFIEKMKITPILSTNGNYYYSYLRGTSSQGFLTVANITGDTSPGEIVLSENGFSLPLELGSTEARVLPINMELEGAKLSYSTSEIHRLRDGHSYELHGHPGTRGRLAFAAPIRLQLNGEVQHARPEGGFFIIDYVHPIKPLQIKNIVIITDSKIGDNVKISVH